MTKQEFESICEIKRELEKAQQDFEEARDIGGDEDEEQERNSLLDNAKSRIDLAWGWLEELASSYSKQKALE